MTLITPDAGDAPGNWAPRHIGRRSNPARLLLTA